MRVHLGYHLQRALALRPRPHMFVAFCDTRAEHEELVSEAQGTAGIERMDPFYTGKVLLLERQLAGPGSESGSL